MEVFLKNIIRGIVVMMVRVMIGRDQVIYENGTWLIQSKAAIQNYGFFIQTQFKISFEKIVSITKKYSYDDRL
jgi:hypothetical protein